MTPREHLEYTRIPIHMALEFAEWVVEGMWRHEILVNNIYTNVGWYNEPYFVGIITLSTNELFIRFIEETRTPTV